MKPLKFSKLYTYHTKNYTKAISNVPLYKMTKQIFMVLHREHNTHMLCETQVYEHMTETTTATLRNATTIRLQSPTLPQLLQNLHSMYDNVHHTTCREKPMKTCQASWCHGQDSHQVLPSEPIPSVDLHNIHHKYQDKCLIHIPVTLVCPDPSSYNSPPVHILHSS
jgi:hypothetical protein